MKIKFTDNQGEAFSNVEVTFLTKDGEVVFITDNEGVIEFFEAEKGEKIICYIHENEQVEFVFDENELPILKLKAPLIDMVFVTIGKEEESVTGASVFFEYLGKKIEKKSDNTGQIILEGIPVNTNVKVYQVYKEAEHNVEINKCVKEKAQYFIVAEKFYEIASMKFKLVDKTGLIIRNADIRFKVGDNEFETVTDHFGCVIVEDIKIGDTVECKQLMFGKSLPWHKFKCEQNIDEYILHGEKASLYGQNSEKYESQVRMKFKLVNSKIQPIPNAVLRLEYGINVRNKYTNQLGEAMIDDVLIGDKIKAMVALNGKKVEAEFICQKDDELHEIIFKTRATAAYFWIIPLIFLIVFIVFYANSNKNNIEDETEEIIVKKDTVIISNYSFYIKSTKNSIPVSGSRIKLIYDNTFFEQITDEKGFTKFAAIDKKLPVKYEISSIGFQSLNKAFTLDSVFKINLIEDDSTDIAYEILPCSTTLESKGVKTTIRNFKMNISKGQFKIWYNLFDLPDKVEIYNGKANSISEKNLIFSNKDYLTGISNPTVEFNSQDSIVTVKMTGKSGKTSWVYKIFCAKQYVKIVP